VGANVLVEDGWKLEPPADADIDELMGWFPDARSVSIWGGPGFRYPFTRDSFLEDCQIAKMSSYCLRKRGGDVVAFGQFYDRHGRAHLARLISHPATRREGAGTRLIKLIMRAASREGDYAEASLFVYRDNAPACACYQSLGFRIQDYPQDAKMKDECFFLTRPIDVE
jgi:ribosomal protein S18 acetylase RimI-like enzyme